MISINMAAQVKQSEPQGWTCKFCTFLNHGDLQSCEMCLQPRFDKGQTDSQDDSNVEAKNAENDSKQTGSIPNNNNINNNNNSNNSNNNDNRPFMSDNTSSVLDSLKSIANDLFNSQDINVVNAGIYLNNIVSAYESMVDKTKKYGYVSFGIYSRNFGECFTVIKANSFRLNVDKQSFGKKISICRDAEKGVRRKSIYALVHNIRVLTNKVAHCVGVGMDAKKRFLTKKEQKQVLYNVFSVAKVLHKWKCGKNNINNNSNSTNVFRRGKY